MVVLPLPLTPQTMITVGPDSANLIGASSWAIRLLSFCFQVSSICCERDDAAAVVRGDFLDDLLDGVVAHVGLEEDRPHFVEERLVDQPALGLEEVADVGLQDLGGLLETLLEAVEKAHGEGWGLRVEGSGLKCGGRDILWDGGGAGNGLARGAVGGDFA